MPTPYVVRESLLVEAGKLLQAVPSTIDYFSAVNCLRKHDFLQRLPSSTTPAVQFVDEAVRREKIRREVMAR